MLIPKLGPTNAAIHTKVLSTIAPWHIRVELFFKIKLGIPEIAYCNREIRKDGPVHREPVCEHSHVA
jgi:hypothetical protein